MHTGRTLGHYTVGDLIGSGGMGEVYRARDTRLGRDVALKFLPEAFTADDGRLARFEREAQLLAQLHHPHIASIFGLEESDGVRALVMELVEGPTLAERLERGAPSLEECLSIAGQIAEALEEAHGKGIIHRDLKPQNIKLTEDGTVKVLDFGLAKAMDPAAGTLEAASDSTASPTLTVGGTVQGVILGSAPYMSPEQAKGVAVDERADIWGFGVVLFEMLSGKRLFTGDSIPETLAGVLKTEVDFSELRIETPAEIRRLLRRCLQRKRKMRLHHIADARLVIDDVVSGTDGDEMDPAIAPTGSTPSRASRWWPAAVVLVGLVAGLLGYLVRSGDAAPAAPMRLAIQLAANQQLVTAGNSVFVFTPDGGSLVFTGIEAGRQNLFRRGLDEPQAVPIPGTDNADGAFFSPDGRWIGFVARGQLMKIAAEGGRPFPLAEARGAGGATWLTDDTIVYAPIYSDGLFRIPAEGGTSVRLTTPDRAAGELGHWWPQLLPGEKQVLFTAFRTPVDRSRVGVLDLESEAIRWVVDEGFFGRYVHTGHLLYAKSQRLYAVPFDPASGTTSGAAVAVVDDLRVSLTGGYANFAVSDRGTLAYATESLGNPLSEVVWLDRDGNATPVMDEQHRYLSVSLSPDDRQAAFTIREENRDLWTYSFERRTLSRLTTGDLTEFDPMWSRDGRELFYVVDSPPFELHRISVGAPDSGRPIWDEPAELDTTQIGVSPDGRTIAYAITEEQTGINIYARPIDGSEPQQTVRVTRSEEDYPSFSPDGKWIVYHSDETGRYEIYVEGFPGPAERVQVSADGGTEPLWARNGEIFYRHDDEVRVVATRLGERFEFDPPRTLFSFPIVAGILNDLRPYDVTADGKRLIAVTIPDANRPRRIEIVTDWLDELERLVP